MRDWPSALILGITTLLDPSRRRSHLKGTGTPSHIAAVPYRRIVRGMWCAVTVEWEPVTGPVRDRGG